MMVSLPGPPSITSGPKNGFGSSVAISTKSVPPATGRKRAGRKRGHSTYLRGRKRGHSTYLDVLVCHAVGVMIPVRGLLQFSSASEYHRTVCHEQGCGGAT